MPDFRSWSRKRADLDNIGAGKPQGHFNILSSRGNSGGSLRPRVITAGIIRFDIKKTTKKRELNKELIREAGRKAKRRFERPFDGF